MKHGSCLSATNIFLARSRFDRLCVTCHRSDFLAARPLCEGYISSVSFSHWLELIKID
ncbi:hypothetical protein SynA1524_02126 [Synechococcus sp. A15-24]|nr:hypothetical protein SynA1524_02126 [Synechococcus sp. A15-24]